MFHLLQTVTSSAKEEIITHTDSVRVMIEEAAHTLVTNPEQFFESLIKSGIDFGLKVLAALFVYTLGVWFIRHVRKGLTKSFTRKKTDSTIASFILSLVTISMTVMLIIITVGTLGVDTTSLAALLAAGGMAIGMALSGTVQNFAGGMMIIFFRPFKVGDYITAQGHSGTVKEVTMVNTKIKTYDNNIVILPNGALFNGNIDNFSNLPVHRLVWKVGLEYGTDSEAAKKLMLQIMEQETRIIKDESSPLPSVVLSSLKDSSIEFQMRAWVKTEDYWPVLYEINERIYKTLPENGFNFPYPQMDINIRKSS